MPQRDAVLVVTRGAGPDQRMEGGLQQPQTALLAGQSHAQRVRHATGTGKTGRIRPNINPRTLLKAGGNLGLRSMGEAQGKKVWRPPLKSSRSGAAGPGPDPPSGEDEMVRASPDRW